MRAGIKTIGFTGLLFGKGRFGLMPLGRVPMVGHLKNARAAAQIDQRVIAMAADPAALLFAARRGA